MTQLKEVVVLRTGFNPTRSASPCYNHTHAHNNTYTKMNLSTVKWPSETKTNPRELLGLFICVRIALCTIVAHNIAQNKPDNFPSYPPDNHHCSDDVYLREGDDYAQCRVHYSERRICQVPTCNDKSEVRTILSIQLYECRASKLIYKNKQSPKKLLRCCILKCFLLEFAIFACYVDNVFTARRSYAQYAL